MFAFGELCLVLVLCRIFALWGGLPLRRGGWPRKGILRIGQVDFHL